MALTLCLMVGGAMATANADLNELQNLINSNNEVTLNKDYMINGPLLINKDIVINGNGRKISVPDDSDFNRLVYINANDNRTVYNADAAYQVTFNKVNFENSKDAGRCVETRGGGCTVTFVECNLTANKGQSQAITVGGDTTKTTTLKLQKTSINTLQGGYAIVTFNKSDITIEAQSSLKGYGLVYLKGAKSPNPATGVADAKNNDAQGSSGSTVLIKNSTLDSTNTVSQHESNGFASIIVENSTGVTVDVVDSTIISSSVKGNDQMLLAIQGTGAAEATISGESVIEGDLIGSEYGGDETKTDIDAQSGTFTVNPSAYTGTSPVAAVSSDNAVASTFVVGKAGIEKAVQNGADELVIVSGNADLTLPAGVKVTNYGGTVIINGTVVGNYATIITEKKVSSSSAPQTGDNSNIALWLALMALSAAGVIVIGKKARFN